MTERNPARDLRRAHVVVLIGVIFFFIPAMIWRRSHPHDDHLAGLLLAFLGFAIVTPGLIWRAFLELATRCPFCNGRISARNYPRPGRHCPRCGRTADDEATPADDNITLW